MPFLLRVELPDVPGSLGRVATAIGEAGGDIEAIEIVEKRDGTAVDDVLLEMHGGAMPDSVVSACNVLDGVRVMWISRYAAGGNIFLDLEVVEELTADPNKALDRRHRPAAGRVPLRLGDADPSQQGRRATHRRGPRRSCRSSTSRRRPASRSTATRSTSTPAPASTATTSSSSAAAAAPSSSTPSWPASATWSAWPPRWLARDPRRESPRSAGDSHFCTEISVQKCRVPGIR